ncbi:MAG: alpha,alpha-trehalose-phosphate synthase (UDP-forming) [Acidimicrobiales bacterium]
MVVASNRGPLSFSRGPDGELHARRGAGGLVSSLGPLAREADALWVASAISEADREAATKGVLDEGGFRIRLLALGLDEYRMAYDVVSNGTLWFVHHGLYDLPRRPRFDRRWREAWAAYRAMNLAFARVIIDEAPDGAIVLVQDYHLALVGTWLAQERRDLRAMHFTHIPFCEPGALRVLPSEVAEELLVGMSSHSSCGFHARRWATNFEDCCTSMLGLKPATFVSPMTPDPDDIGAVAASEECAAEVASLDASLGDRKLIVRVDRIELSKNLLRGFLAFDDLLRFRPEWRGKVVFAALIYPSREGLPEYLSYRQEVETLAHHVNAIWATPDWTPVTVDTTDNFPRSVAALRRYDVLLVNPVRDGLNLVAKEGVLVNERDGVLALSREAGAWEELSDVALEVNPFDIAGTSDVLATALAMTPEQRKAHATALYAAATARKPRDWLDDQLRVAADSDEVRPPG